MLFFGVLFLLGCCVVGFEARCDVSPISFCDDLCDPALRVGFVSEVWFTGMWANLRCLPANVQKLRFMRAGVICAGPKPPGLVFKKHACKWLPATDVTPTDDDLTLDSMFSLTAGLESETTTRVPVTVPLTVPTQTNVLLTPGQVLAKPLVPPFLSPTPSSSTTETAPMTQQTSSTTTTTTTPLPFMVSSSLPSSAPFSLSLPTTSPSTTPLPPLLTSSSTTALPSIQLNFSFQPSTPSPPSLTTTVPPSSVPPSTVSATTHFSNTTVYVLFGSLGGALFFIIVLLIVSVIFYRRYHLSQTRFEVSLRNRSSSTSSSFVRIRSFRTTRSDTTQYAPPSFMYNADSDSEEELFDVRRIPATNTFNTFSG